MLTAVMFDGVATALTTELTTVIPVAIGVFATLFGIRKAIALFKGVAR